MRLNLRPCRRPEKIISTRFPLKAKEGGARISGIFIFPVIQTGNTDFLNPNIKFHWNQDQRLAPSVCRLYGEIITKQPSNIVSIEEYFLKPLGSSLKESK